MTQRSRPQAGGHAEASDHTTSQTGNLAAQRSRSLGRWFGLALLAAGLLFALQTGHALFFSADVPFLVGGPGPWITAPRTIDTQLVAVDPAAPPRHVFIRRFDALPGDSARLELRALTRFDVEVNGRLIPTEAGTPSWRRVQSLEITSALRAGRNELRVAVTNPKGPPLLQARLAIGDRIVPGHSDWQVVTPGSNPSPARLADDTRRHPDAFLLPEPGQVLAQHTGLFALGFAACLAIACGLELLRPTWLRDQAAAFAGAFAVVMWLGVFLMKTSRLPAVMGFDAPAHMQYIEGIRNGLRLPLADEGFSAYHPPLAHVLTAAVAALFGADASDAAMAFAYRLVPFASGFACVVFAGATARLLWPQDSRRIAVAILTASVMPVGVYMAAYIGNESMHAAWVSAAIFIATRILTETRARRSDLVWLGVLFGLGLLTKFTSLALAPIILAFVAAKLFFFEARPGRSVAAAAVTVIAIAAALSGWFYVRNWIVFGDPLVWNLDIPGAATWWLQPGFHTPSWLLSFGEGVRHPFFAGFVSYWDGLYSTFWGDGLVAGMQTARTRHGAWNDSLMLVGLWLAIPATGMLAWGSLRAVRDGLRIRDPQEGAALARAMMVTLTGALIASSFLISLRLPFYAQARSSYLLAVIVPISVAAADGILTIHDHLPDAIRRPGRMLMWSVLLALLLVLTGSFLA